MDSMRPIQSKLHQQNHHSFDITFGNKINQIIIKQRYLNLICTYTYINIRVVNGV